MVIAALVVSIVAAAGSVGAVWYSRRSAKSAAVSAAATSAAATLDSQRRHDELTPEFYISITAGENGVGDHAEMRVALTGPGGLDRLDEVTIAILDEAGVNHWAHGLPGKLSPEEARRFVWGPWEFNTGASAQVTDNRTTRPRSYSRPDGKNWDQLGLTRTRPGHWMSITPEQWRRQQAGPVRLQITCARSSASSGSSSARSRFQSRHRRWKSNDRSRRSEHGDQERCYEQPGDVPALVERVGAGAKGRCVVVTVRQRRVLPPRRAPAGAAVALGADAASHYWADRRVPLRRLAESVGSVKTFAQRIVRPLIDYLDEQIVGETAILYALERYVRRVEWFDRDELHARYREDTGNGEKMYEKDMRRFLSPKASACRSRRPSPHPGCLMCSPSWTPMTRSSAS